MTTPRKPDSGFGCLDASFQAAGGYDGIKKLVDRFYDYMDQLPEAQRIREMHPADLAVSRDKLTRFLCGWLGGPRLYQEKYGPIHIPLAHQHLDIGHEDKAAWLRCMEKALEDIGYRADFREYLLAQLSIPAERIRAVSGQRQGR